MADCSVTLMAAHSAPQTADCSAYCWADPMDYRSADSTDDATAAYSALPTADCLAYCSVDHLAHPWAASTDHSLAVHSGFSMADCSGFPMAVTMDCHSVGEMACMKADQMDPSMAGCSATLSADSMA